MEETFVSLIGSLGFPIFVAVVLLYDKMKTNGRLAQVVENNSYILKEIKDLCERGFSR